MQKSVLFRLSGAVVLLAGLAACESSPYGGSTLTPDAQRAAGGALAGAAIAKIADEDVATGALIGGAAGALCDDAGVCKRRY